MCTMWGPALRPGPTVISTDEPTRPLVQGARSAYGWPEHPDDEGEDAPLKGQFQAVS